MKSLRWAFLALSLSLSVSGCAGFTTREPVTLTPEQVATLTARLGAVTEENQVAWVEAASEIVGAQIATLETKVDSLGQLHGVAASPAEETTADATRGFEQGKKIGEMLEPVAAPLIGPIAVALPWVGGGVGGLILGILAMIRRSKPVKAPPKMADPQKPKEGGA